jgi:hypothetical protein
MTTLSGAAASVGLSPGLLTVGVGATVNRCGSFELALMRPETCRVATSMRTPSNAARSASGGFRARCHAS